MKSREKIITILALVTMAGTAAGLQYLKSKQQLGEPGINSTPIEGSLRREIALPREVPGYTAEIKEADPIVVGALPDDTSFAQAIYTDSLGRSVQTMVVMMGTDRTSIHKPQFCLTGQGWGIDETRSSRETIRLVKPAPIDLPVMKLIASHTLEIDGQQRTVSGVYVYWFVSGDSYTEDHWQRMWWMAQHLVNKGELQRWSYITYFMVCQPGQEEAAFEHIKQLIRATVPSFQSTWPKEPKSP